ncbi:alkaline shock response membrane anchor protein AmaP [Caldicellulosiruptoraceae bacterium PP1]
MKLVERIILSLYTILVLVFSLVLFLLPFNLIDFSIIDNIITRYINNPVYSIIPLAFLALSIYILTIGIKKRKIRLGIIHVNDKGQLIISPKTFESSAYYVLKKYSSVKDAIVETSFNEEGIEFTIDASIMNETNIPELTNDIQNNLKNYIENITGVKVTMVNLHIKDVYIPQPNTLRVR